MTGASSIGGTRWTRTVEGIACGGVQTSKDFAVRLWGFWQKIIFSLAEWHSTSGAGDGSLDCAEAALGKG